MEIDVDKWNPETFPTGKTIGRARVVFNGKMYVWVSVICTEKGHLFARFPSFKEADNTYHSSIGWVDKPEMEKQIGSQVVKILKERYLND
jgi:hypothetical protein